MGEQYFKFHVGRLSELETESPSTNPIEKSKTNLIIPYLFFQQH